MIEWLVEVAQRLQEPSELRRKHHDRGSTQSRMDCFAKRHEELGDSVNGTPVGMVGETRFPKSCSRAPHLGKGTRVSLGRGGQFRCLSSVVGNRFRDGYDPDGARVNRRDTTCARTTEESRSKQGPHNGALINSGSWEQLDQIDLGETFLHRVPMLRSCPRFLRGRLRFSFGVAL